MDASHVQTPRRTRSAPRKGAGFTLLFSVIISSLVLALGLAIFNLVIKEVQLAFIARDSQQAFYAADIGWECAVYWDFEEDAFATSSDATQIECADTTVTVDPPGGYGLVAEFTVMTDSSDPSKPCVDVEVYQEPTAPRTEIRSNGFNTCNTTSPRRVQRTIVVEY